MNLQEIKDQLRKKETVDPEDILGLVNALEAMESVRSDMERLGNAKLCTVSTAERKTGYKLREYAEKFRDAVNKSLPRRYS